MVALIQRTMLAPIILILTCLPLHVSSGNVPEGGACSPSNTHLDPSSHKLLSDCSETTFCSSSSSQANITTSSSTTSTSSTGTCQPRLCRRDEFPFWYYHADESGPSNASAPLLTLPPLCPVGRFCPDEGSGCRPLVAPGQPCEMNRDDQCAPPPGSERIALSSERNVNGSICLREICMYANATLGQACIIDNNTYVDEGPDGRQYINSIARDNCRTTPPQPLYCDGASLQCVPSKPLGAACDADRECESYKCGSSGTCVPSPSMPLRIAPWKYAITAVCVLACMTATLAALVFVHKRLRLQRYREIREYYDEQMSLRRSMAALHAAVAERHRYSDAYADEDEK
ncbi:uncharacterized protein LAESUDRAFT_816206 [Laetiporus sulphureus 93-53]|uniref:Uncharacterized protein n=1 Tax=Laetiporus sulphureus 93-53 TaxID=1314785 RepID=A0A165BFD9_9APHY|nr:uncharacterized protein LAESUDRAFT_816206 [Laetiporus sulphureus 93-53]KZT00938.1 hypothetical protein LAESUDRAFT_816206 [Laetiporus sulphureus 93-53]